jgi:UDP-N-acetylmuramoylalanine--D-glutamate ligase
MAGQRALVLGAGLSGLAAARLLKALGAEVMVSDRKDPSEISAAGELLSLGAALVGEEEAEDKISSLTLLVLSPGVSVNHPLAERARDKGLLVIGEMELGFRGLGVPILAVTGSNGKTTTTSLTGHILEKQGLSVFVGGNIGNPLSSLALNLLKGEKKPDYAVLEVSSFQLEAAPTFRALAAAFLNLTPDHLDRHGSLEGYLKAKSLLIEALGPEGRAILNFDDPMVRDLPSKAKIYGFSRLTRPLLGAYADGLSVMAVDGDKILASREWKDFSLEGGHNQENVMAAVLLAGAAGAEPEKALNSAALFAPGDHRLETVGIFGGVRWIDDSKGTNVGAVAAALEAVKEKVVLIMGGRDKDLDFGYLAPYVRKKVKKLVLIGECREKIAQSLGKDAPYVMAESMREAVRISKEAAESGEAVLLSPAAASFDMFKDYKERGEAFRREAVRQAEEEGEILAKLGLKDRREEEGEGKR